MRSALRDPRKTYVVMPDGRITATYFDIGIESPFVSYSDNDPDMTPAIKPEAKKRGITLLEDHYALEKDPKIRDQGYKVFCDWWSGAWGQGANTPSIDSWLPQSVVDLRLEHEMKPERQREAMPVSPRDAKRVDTPSSKRS